MAIAATPKIFGRNPDVLDSIANLSNDEVFTPPWLAKQMLDSLEKAWSDSNNGANIWENPAVTFLDPFTKSGVFLREIVARLTKGLEKEFPDLQDRVDHIVTKQVFGIAITQLTSLMARRSTYCSKYANGKHSITKKFDTEDGNIKFETTQHEWVGGKTFVETADANGNPTSVPTDGKCRFCGASQTTLDREEGLETHAYSFIHKLDIEKHISHTFGVQMQFDVIIGNPPYHLSTEGYGTQARPIYHKFVTQAKSLEPRFLSMVIPARWFSGGMGLDEFRASMLHDSRLRVIHDFPDSNEVFPGTQIKGGVCFFLWDRDNSGDVEVTTHDKGVIGPTVRRALLEPGSDVFIRYNEAIPIFNKVLQVEHLSKTELASYKDQNFSSLVSQISPFGLDTKFRGKPTAGRNDVKVYRNGGVGFIDRAELSKGLDLVDTWKVFIPPVGSGSDSFPHPILGKPFVGEPGTISSWTYLCIGPFSDESTTINAISYITSRLFRFLVLLRKPSQHANRGVYRFVPIQDFSMPWTDEMLYRKYGISPEEIAFIESKVRPMELTDEQG